MSYFQNAGVLLVQVLFGILLAVVMLRVLLQLVRANFYNPICQGLYRATNPVLMPLQKAIPSWRNLNLAGVLLAYVVALVWVLALFSLAGQVPGVLGLLVLAFAKLLDFGMTIMIWLIVIRALMSFVSADRDNPVVPLLVQLTDPVLKPFQRIIPPLGGFDLSPIVAIVVLYLGQALVAAPLYDLGRAL